MIKTEWNLSLLYKNNSDPQIEKDIQKVERIYTNFAKKYSANTSYLRNEDLLLRALKEYEALYETNAAKVYLYFAYKADLNSKDSAVEAKMNLASLKLDAIGNIVLFFTVALSKIPEATQKKFLKSKKLSHYHYFLKCCFAQGKYTLSEAEEKILNRVSLPAHSLWIQGNEKIINKQEISWKGKNISIPEAIAKIRTLSAKERNVLHARVYERLQSISDFAENEINALVTNKKIEDELRGYARPYDATILGYQNERETVEQLISLVTKQFSISHRFYKLKAKMLGVRTFSYADRSASIGRVQKKIEFKKAVEIVQNAFEKVDPAYRIAFDEHFANGQVDVFPKIGKQGGAYCSSYGTLPTFVLLNHIPDLYSVTTMAHEMGHAMHAKFSNETQSPIYRDHTIATAEVASTLFENFVFDEIFPTLSPKEKIIALHDKISDSIQTIFRQVACFNFEVALHEEIRKKGSIAKSEIAKLMNTHMQSYLGPLFRLTEVDGYEFVRWSHIRRFFYVYSYAFGELVSSALHEMYIHDNEGTKKKIHTFLSSGGSASPEDIFKNVGINVRNPHFFAKGLEKIERDIDKLEKLIR